MLNLYTVVHLNEADSNNISGIHVLSNGTFVVISEKYTLKQYNVHTGELLFHKRLSLEPQGLSEVTLMESTASLYHLGESIPFKV